MLAVEIQHHNLFEIEDAVKLMRLFLREKDENIAAAWPKKRLKEFVVSRLQAAGQNDTFLSKDNLLRLQQGFGPMFRELDQGASATEPDSPGDRAGRPDGGSAPVVLRKYDQRARFAMDGQGRSSAV